MNTPYDPLGPVVRQQRIDEVTDELLTELKVLLLEEPNNLDVLSETSRDNYISDVLHKINGRLTTPLTYGAPDEESPIVENALAAVIDVMYDECRDVRRALEPKRVKHIACRQTRIVADEYHRATEEALLALGKDVREADELADDMRTDVSKLLKADEQRHDELLILSLWGRTAGQIEQSIYGNDFTEMLDNFRTIDVPWSRNPVVLEGEFAEPLLIHWDNVRYIADNFADLLVLTEAARYGEPVEFKVNEHGPSRDIDSFTVSEFIYNKQAGQHDSWRSLARQTLSEKYHQMIQALGRELDATDLDDLDDVASTGLTKIAAWDVCDAYEDIAEKAELTADGKALNAARVLIHGSLHDKDLIRDFFNDHLYSGMLAKFDPNDADEIDYGQELWESYVETLQWEAQKMVSVYGVNKTKSQDLIADMPRCLRLYNAVSNVPGIDGLNYARATLHGRIKDVQEYNRAMTTQGELQQFLDDKGITV